MTSPDKPLTQIEKIIVMMFHHPEKEWWVAQDFMPPAVERDHPLHVGYEATARMSDLISKYNPEDDAIPPAFEVGQKGRYRTIRPRYQDFEAVLKAHPDLIPLAQKTKIMDRYYMLNEKVAEYLPKPKETKSKPKFKSYA